MSGSRPCIGGGYLLSHFRSIIDVVRFNFSVRNGKRWSPHAIATLVLFQFRSRLCGVTRPVGGQKRMPEAMTVTFVSPSRSNTLFGVNRFFCFIGSSEELPEALSSFAADVLNHAEIVSLFRLSARLQLCWDFSRERVWAISIARLCTLPCLHLRPIDVLV